MGGACEHRTNWAPKNRTLKPPAMQERITKCCVHIEVSVTGGPKSEGCSWLGFCLSDKCLSCLVVLCSVGAAVVDGRKGNLSIVNPG